MLLLDVASVGSVNHGRGALLLDLVLLDLLLVVVCRQGGELAVSLVELNLQAVDLFLVGVFHLPVGQFQLVDCVSDLLHLGELLVYL